MEGSQAPRVADALVELGDIRRQIALAADLILVEAEKGLLSIKTGKAANLIGFDAVEAALCAILSACAFQDLTSQKLDRAEAWLKGDPSRFVDPLMNGPAPTGAGLDQAAADALFNEVAIRQSAKG